MRTFFFSVAVFCFLGLAGCGSVTGTGSTTSTTSEPTTQENVRPDYKKASMGQGQPFTSEEENVKTLPPGYPMPGDQSKRFQGQQ